MSTNTFTVADYLLTRLKQLNVTDVFQIPGDYVKHFTQALEYFNGINAIGAINELDAAYAADAYARTRGLAAVSLQYGVSTFSALNAIAGAYVERSPIVVISAAPGADMRNQTDRYGMIFHHSTGNLLADQNVYSNVTVAAETLSTNVGAPEKIDNLLIQAITHKRPVYIACYKEVWQQPCPRPSAKPLQPLLIKSEPAALENAVDMAWQIIINAKNPLIWAGVEVLRHGLTGLLQQIIDASGIYYTTTTLGKTVLDEDPQNFIGTYSDAASVKSVFDIVEQSDCIISLGTILTDDYLWFMENKYEYMVLASTDQIRAGYFKYQEITMKDFMEALLRKFKTSAKPKYPLKMTPPKWPVYPEPWESNSDPKFNSKPEVITFNRFFQHTMQFLQDNKMMNDVNMVFGVSCSLYVAANATGLKQGSFIGSAAWQCIGFETGAALGAQLGSGKRSWTVAGDGGFMMVSQSLSTLARNKVNAVIFVMSNGVYAIEQVYVDVKAFQPSSGVPFDAFDILPKWDYAALAKAFGAESFCAETVSDLKSILPKLKALKNKPALVEVIIPYNDLPGQMNRLGEETLPL
ncbi:alpha-keto acid decarboxylase family protein [Chitinophaga sp. LS1]|uniref:alpha-keto acid decarboxylase family protein n=1 Tax=Chitinophaga sp. LS1 TaxID=3051176 RepID=UPI002AABCBA8|nr:thiamine pyrophosphate-dependent enzyme [Chitinophaga sp. LS1]WPV69214.1 thiamine pyrophosphate-binding protein [Chitinophaga sp. LS1]